MLKAIKKFFLVSGEERRLFFQAIWIAILARIYILNLSSKKLPGFLGTPHKESTFETNIAENSVFLKVYMAMRRSTIYLPFKKKCLIEAIVVKKMLQKYNIVTTIYLGVAKDENKNLIAHAWLRYGSKIIVGKKGMERYVAVEWFT